MCHETCSAATVFVRQVSLSAPSVRFFSVCHITPSLTTRACQTPDPASQDLRSFSAALAYIPIYTHLCANCPELQQHVKQVQTSCVELIRGFIDLVQMGWAIVNHSVNIKVLF